MTVETSVIIGVRNGERFLAEAVNSALAQLDPTDEILVVDDGSTDGTRSVVANIRDPRVRVLTGAAKGISSARNIGLAAARGTLIAFLDHDDVWPAGRHAVLRGALSANPSLGAAYGRLRFIYEPDARPYALGRFDGTHICPQIGTALFRRKALDRVAGFDEAMMTGEDVDYFLRLEEAGVSKALCEVDGLTYRRHGGNITNDFNAMKVAMLPVLRRRLSRVRDRQPARG